MPSQNLISAIIAPETKADIMQKLAELRNNLGFLLTLQRDEIQGLFKGGNAYAPFIEKAYNAVSAHPQIMAAVFDVKKFKRDFVLSKDLTSISSQVDQLTDSLNNTLLAANSDAMTGALEVYAAMKQNRDKVPGLNVISDEMGEFFKKAKKENEQKAKF